MNNNYKNNKDITINNEIPSLYIKICGKEAQEYLKCLDNYNEITKLENKNKCKKYLDKFLECNDYTSIK
jgi:hypothetical protein